MGIKNNGYPSSVNDAFRDFCARKTQIVVNLEFMNYSENEDFLSLVMNEVTEREYSDVSDDDVNLFKPVLFELFANVQQIMIVADYFAFDLERLSQFVFPKSLKKVLIQGEWLQDADVGAVMQQYDDKGWSGELRGGELLTLE